MMGQCTAHGQLNRVYVVSRVMCDRIPGLLKRAWGPQSTNFSWLANPKKPQADHQWLHPSLPAYTEDFRLLVSKKYLCMHRIRIFDSKSSCRILVTYWNRKPVIPLNCKQYIVGMAQSSTSLNTRGTNSPYQLGRILVVL